MFYRKFVCILYDNVVLKIFLNTHAVPFQKDHLFKKQLSNSSMHYSYTFICFWMVIITNFFVVEGIVSLVSIQLFMNF